jgi:hypothetical protein
MFKGKIREAAEEVANVVDYHQGLLRDLQGKLKKAIGPIKDSGNHKEFVKDLEAFKDKVDKQVETAFAEKPEDLHKDEHVAGIAAEILDSRPLDKDDVKENVLAPEQHEAVAKAQATMVQAQPQPGQVFEKNKALENNNQKPAPTGPIAPASQPPQEVKK